MKFSHPLFPQKRIFAPGPTPVPMEILKTLSETPLHHRTKEFETIFSRVIKNLKHLHQTEEASVFTLSSSGTGVMEAAVVNHFNSGDKVLVIRGGKFGERWSEISEKYNLNVVNYDVEWGHTIDLNHFENLLTKNSDIKGILFQASETSTGVAHPTEKIAKIVKTKTDALIIVDAITALGVMPLPMDEWHLDVVVCGSQKALMLPPGLATIAVSQKAQSRWNQIKTPRFYYNLASEAKALSKNQTAWTPAVSLICGLDTMLESLTSTPIESLFKHHETLMKATRTGIKSLGIQLLGEGCPSPAVTAAYLPNSLSGKGGQLTGFMRDEFGITIAGGQNHLKGKIFRIGHLGFFDPLDMCTVMSALEMTLNTLGHDAALGTGVAQVQKTLLERA